MADESPKTASRLPLLPLHLGAGASLERFRDGLERPAHYGDVAAEERALYEAVGLSDVSGDDHVDVTGPDRVSFLQGMLTNDLKLRGSGEGCRAAWLTAKARVQMTMAALLMPERVRLVLPPGGADAFVPAIDRYLIMEDATFERVEPPVMLALQGPRAPALLSAVTELDRPRLADLAQFPGTLDHLEIAVVGAPARLVSRSTAATGGVELWTTAADAPTVWAALREAGRDVGLALVGSRARETVRIASGSLAWGAEVEVDTFMAELPMSEWVSFKKGCYLGQEPVARVHFRGRPARQIASLELDGEVLPERDSAVFSRKDDDRERDVGWITAATRSELRGRGLALAFLRVDYLEPGTRLEIEPASDAGGEGGRIACRVVDTPGTAIARATARRDSPATPE